MACGLRLAACGLRLAACGLRLAAKKIVALIFDLSMVFYNLLQFFRLFLKLCGT